MINPYIIGFSCGLVAGIVISILNVLALYIFRVSIGKTVNEIKHLSPSERGSFIGGNEQL